MTVGGKSRSPWHNLSNQDTKKANMSAGNTTLTTIPTTTRKFHLRPLYCVMAVAYGVSSAIQASFIPAPWLYWYVGAIVSVQLLTLVTLLGWTPNPPAKRVQARTPISTATMIPVFEFRTDPFDPDATTEMTIR